MNKTIVIISNLIFILFFFSCTTKNKTENFETFYNNFTTDSIFQKSRIDFPLTFKYLDIDNDYEKKEIIINENDWNFQNLDWEESYATRDLDAYTRNIQISKDTTNVKFEGVNNGINFGLSYIIKDGKWVLVEMYDYSN